MGTPFTLRILKNCLTSLILLIAVSAKVVELSFPSVDASVIYL